MKPISPERVSTAPSTRVAHIAAAMLAFGPHCGAESATNVSTVFVSYPQSRVETTRSRPKHESDDNVRSEGAVLPAEPKSLIESVFGRYLIKPSRVRSTSDGSELFEFFGSTNACVDVYPNGDVVIIIAKGEIDEYYELKASDFGLIIKILNDAGVC